MLIFVYGGTASGKSAYAESLAASLAQPAPLIYLATMDASDPESLRRIARHRQQRAFAPFRTVEQPRGIGQADFPQGAVVLVECLSTLTANELFFPGADPQTAATAVLKGLSRLCARAAHTVVVSSDVFRDGGTYPPATRQYIRLLGHLHQTLAQRADHVVEIVASIPLPVKGGLPL